MKKKGMSKITKQKRKVRQSDKDFTNLVRAGLTETRLHVKVGTHPAYYAIAEGIKQLPKIGDCLSLKNELKNGKPLKVRCVQIKDDTAFGDSLYVMDLC